MKIIKTRLNDCYILEPEILGDNRGYFTEYYSQKKLNEFGIDFIAVQGNESLSSVKGTLRGLHFQCDKMVQAKVVRVTKGIVYDVVVDLREKSSTYKQWIKVELSENNHKQLYIPKGFAHGFVTVSDQVIFSYLVDNYYSKESEGGILYNDPELNIDWGVENPIISDKDKSLLTLKDSNYKF